MIFSQNQATQFYALKDGDKIEVKNIKGVGKTIQITDGTSNKVIYTTDTITNQLWAVHAAANTMEKHQKKITITVNKDYVVPGQDYILTFTIRNPYGNNNEAVVLKHAVAHAVKTDTAATLAEKLKKSLEWNIERDATKPLVAEVSGANLVIKGAEQPWVRGKLPYQLLSFEVSAAPITDGGVDTIEWAKIGDPEADATAIPNSKEVADMEWFFQGNKGDLYREAAYPNNIDFEYRVDGKSATGYDLLTIHYAYVGDNESVQKSEKTIVIAAPADNEALAGIVGTGDDKIDAVKKNK